MHAPAAGFNTYGRSMRRDSLFGLAPVARLCYLTFHDPVDDHHAN
jgi:hypothetical protein